MNLTLYTYPGNPRAFKALIAAQYNGIKIDIPAFEMGVDNKKPEFIAKNPIGKVPVLDTPEGSIFESNAIARYIARLRNDTKLYGKTFVQSGQIDSWIDFVANEMDVPICMLLYPVLGYMPYNATANSKAIQDCKKALQILENHLLLRTYLVGDQITLADIICFSTLVYPFKMLFDKEFRKPYPCVLRWFTTLANQKEFISVVGDVPLCDKSMINNDSNNKNKDDKSTSKKKDNKKKDTKINDKEKQEEQPVAKPKKVEHPLVVLNREKPSSFIMDEWKVCYSNTKDLNKAMEWFWQKYDKEGYSLFFCDYKYNEENEKLFMTSNAVSGFLQRSEAMRKFAFGVMDVLGEEGKEISITGCWLFRGQTAKHMIEANPDAEYYEWKKVEKLDDVTKKKITAYWVNEDTLNGKPIADSKVFK